MYGGGKHIKFDLKSANKDTGVKENKVVIRDVENPISNGNKILVDYKLNKERALRKKADACSRDDFKITHNKSSCVVILNTAAFEHFKTDLNEWVKENPQYMVYSETPVLDLDQNIAQDVLRVKWCNDCTVLCTINLYRTNCKVMINGADYKIFVERDLPGILYNLQEKTSGIREQNDFYRLCLNDMLQAKTRTKLTRDYTGECNVKGENLVRVKRERKKRNFDGYYTSKIKVPATKKR